MGSATNAEPIGRETQLTATNSKMIRAGFVVSSAFALTRLQPQGRRPWYPQSTRM